MIGRSIMTLIPSDRHNEEAEIIAQIRIGERIDHYETVRQRRDGSRVDVSLTISPVKEAGGKVIGASKIARDISERKKAQLALAERDAQLALAGKVALVGSYAVDVNSGRVRLSAGCAAIRGFAEGTEEVQYSAWRANVHPDDLARLDRQFKQAFAAWQCEYSTDYRILRSGGEARWIEARALISYDGNGRAACIVGVSIDITERKRAEEQQRILVAELDHRVKNVLATVQAVAGHTMGASRSMKHFVAALDGRIRSMGSTHELLSHRRWAGVPLAELVERELAPYRTASNTEIGGPESKLRANPALDCKLCANLFLTNSVGRSTTSFTPDGVRCQMEIPLAKLCVVSSRNNGSASAPANCWM
jgi:PAS domain S-box-containing protein